MIGIGPRTHRTVKNLRSKRNKNDQALLQFERFIFSRANY
jgi:hypothetical protein